jgi:PAS domain S-box-containing protein
MKISTGEVAELAINYDWSQTPLGASETWSAELRAAVVSSLSDRANFPTTNSSDSNLLDRTKAQQRYNTLLDRVEKGFAISEMLFDDTGKPFDYRFLEINHLFESMTGLENATGKTALELISNLESFWVETYGKLALTREPIQFEHRVETLNRWFEVRAFPIDDPLEFRFGVLFTDITQRKLDAERLKLIGSRLEISLAAGDVGVWDFDMVDRTIWRSIEHDRLFGYEQLQEEWNFERFLSHVIPADRERVTQAFQIAIASNTPHEVEFGIHQVSGETRWIWIRGITERNQDGEAIRLYGVIRDVSDRTRREHSQSFLLEIQKDLSFIEDFGQMLEVVSQKMRVWFDFSLLAFANVDMVTNSCTTFYTSSNDGDFPQVATYKLSDFFVEDRLRRLQTGEIVVINDTNENTEIQAGFGNLGIRSSLILPYINDGEWRFVISGNRPEPSGWREDEIELMSDLVPRIYLEIERSRAETSLEQANQRFKLAMQAVSGIIFEWNVQSASVYRSEGLFELIGFNGEEVPPTSEWWFDLVHPEDRANLESVISQLANGQNFYEREYRIRHANGHYIDIWERSVVQRNELGDAVKVVGFTTDISDRKNAERQLWESEARMRLTMVGTNMGDWELDLVENKLWWSERSFRLLGYEPTPTGEANQEMWIDCSSVEDQARATEIWERAVAEQIMFRNEYQMTRHDNQQTIWLEVFASFDFDRNGRAIRARGVSFDISDRKRNETALTQSEERYRNLVELIPQLVWTADHRGNLLDVNQRWLDYTGLSSTQQAVENVGLRNFSHPDDRDFLSDAWQLCQKKGVPLQTEGRIRGQDGIYRWYLHQAVPQKNQRGEVVKWYGACTDIDAQKQLEKEYANLLQKLQERNQDLDQFSYIVSHDLKAPLRAIANLSEWLEDDLLDIIPVESKEQLQLMRSRVFRMEALIDGLLNYARIGREEIEPEEVYLSEILTDIIDLLDPPATFVIELPDNLPCILTKRISLNQVLSNLVGNGIKHYGSTDGKITISFKEESSFYEFAIADNGKGIPLEQQSRVFDIFQTLDKSNSNSTGIGLAIVKKIVETEGGKIQLRSEVGKGSTFSFTWRKY